MFTLGFIKRALFGVSLGLISRLIVNKYIKNK